MRATLPDPRHLQIAFLGLLLGYGLLALDFEVSPGRAALLIGVTLAAQALASLLLGLPQRSAGALRPPHPPEHGASARPTSPPRIELRSALISGLSLCLLLRTGSAWVAVLAALLTVGSKFLVRVHGKHVFNPTNFGIGVAVAATGQAWISPGQWGSAALLAFLVACLGLVVTLRAERSDVTWAFLLSWAGLLFARSAYLGEPLSIPLHRLESGAILLFAFFMISDPKTTPDSRTGRILFALLVALVGYHIQFRLFRTNGPFWALLLMSPLVPLLDRLLPATRYRWKGEPDDASPGPAGDRPAVPSPLEAGV